MSAIDARDGRTEFTIKLIGIIKLVKRATSQAVQDSFSYFDQLSL